MRITYLDEEEWPSKYYPQYTIELKNVYIVDKGVILDSNFNYIKECNFQYAFWNNLKNTKLMPKNVLSYLKSDIDYGKTVPEGSSENRNIEGTWDVTETLDDKTDYIYGMHYFGWYPYGHHWEVLQPLEKLEFLKPESSKLLVCGVKWDSIKDFDKQLSLFGFPEERVKKIRVNSNEKNPPSCVFIPKLFYSSPACYFTQVSERGLSYIEKFYSSIITPKHKQPTKLYLSRQLAKRRKVKNNKEVQEFLIKNGFTIVDGTENFEKHIELFRNAEIVVGPHGSMFNNILFSPGDVRVIEFCPETRRDYNFRGLGQTRGLDYHWIASPCDKDFNIQINMQTLEALL